MHHTQIGGWEQSNLQVILNSHVKEDTLLQESTLSLFEYIPYEKCSFKVILPYINNVDICSPSTCCYTP